MNQRSFTLRVGATPKWLMLLSLAWFQVSLAAHHDEHGIDEHESAETCTICLQLDRADDVIVDAVSTPLSPSSSFEAIAPQRVETRFGRFSLYQSRASP